MDSEQKTTREPNGAATMDRPEERASERPAVRESRPENSPPPPAAPHEEHALPTNLRRPSAITVIAVLLLFVLVLVGLFFLGLGPHRAAEKQARQDAAEQANMRPVVNLIKPERSDSHKTLTWPADVRANQETAIYTRANGFLKTLKVDIGSHVKAGDLLAEIDAPDIDAQLAQSRASLEQARANVAKAQADLTLAQQTLTRYRDLQRGGANTVTQQEVDEKQAAQDQAVAELAQAKANVGVAEQTVQRYKVMQGFEKITAPFDGVITARNYDVGALLSPTDVGPGKQIFSLAQTDPVRVFVNVPQVYATSVKNGEPAYLTVRNYPGRKFTGTVFLRSDAIDPNTRVMTFELHFPNPDGALVPGMYGDVQIGVTEEHPVLVIPSSALLYDAHGTRVAAVRDGKIHFEQVKVGEDRGETLEITDGLSPDDQIVATPGEQLTEGAEVQVASSPQTRVAENH